MKRKVFQLNTELYKVTGIQRVMLDIHEALRDDFDAKIVGNIPFDKVNDNLGIPVCDYLRLRNPFMFRNSVVIIHERRLLPFMWLLGHIPGLNIKCIYIHHNELYGNRWLSLFPKNVVAISDAGIKNLTEYFGIPRSHITKIHNCVRNTVVTEAQTRSFNSDDIKILYPARINTVKRQIEIVSHLKGKLDSRVRILFAGVGPLYQQLQNICTNDEQFQALGFRDDIPSLMKTVDFIMLFSQQEGLPISLLEAIQIGLPAICNNVGGNSEIIDSGKNGILVDDWEDLLSTLNNLPNLSQAEMAIMQHNARVKFNANFNFEIFKTKYINLMRLIYENT